MPGNRNLLKRVLPFLIFVLVLGIALAMLGNDTESSLSSDAASPSGDTRFYNPGNLAGIPLRMDLKLPDVPRQAENQLAASAFDGPLAAQPDDPESSPDSSGFTWVHFLAGILVLGAGTAWLRKYPVDPVRRRVSHRTPPAAAAENLADGEAFLDAAADGFETASPGNQIKVSIQLLKQHIEQNPGDSHAPWLLLLDLLHRAGDAQEYAETRRRCKQYFNVDMPEYRKIKSASKKQGIESYPHIMSKLLRLWPSDETAGYLNALLHDSRDGSRVGFDLDTYRDIALLRSIQETVSSSEA